MQCFHDYIILPAEAYSFTADGYGNYVRTHVGVSHTHEGGSGTNESAQEFIRLGLHKSSFVWCTFVNEQTSERFFFKLSSIMA